MTLLKKYLKENLENGRSKLLKKTLLDKPMFIKIKY